MLLVTNQSLEGKTTKIGGGGGNILGPDLYHYLPRPLVTGAFIHVYIIVEKKTAKYDASNIQTSLILFFPVWI